ncbi:MAG TPA: UvrD-helicase domain-containing protein, partial [Burkholderiaceae bacterium]
MDAARFAPLDVFTCPLAGLRQIEASAGTGKTWNICGLYLRLLLERGMTVQQVLVVTFTKAATAELRERIRQRIVDTLAYLRPAHDDSQPPGDGFVERLVQAAADHHDLTDAEMVARLERALASFDEAAIHTIHGFCQRAIGDAPFSTRMPLVQEQLEDDAAHVAEAANDFWRRHVAADGFDAALAAHLLSRGDDPARFARLLKRHLGKPLAREIWPEDVEDVDLVASAGGESSAAAAEGAPPVGERLAALHADARAAWMDGREAIAAMLREALELEAFKANMVDADKLAAALQGWDDRLGDDDALAWLEVDDRQLKRIELLGSAKLASATKKKFAPPGHAFFEHAQALLDERAQAADRLERARLALLRRLLREGAQAQRAAKRRARVVAFDDMLFNLYERLASPESPGLAASLRARYPAALVDEFQDTDPLQFAVFRAIYAGDAARGTDAAAPVFFVGDPKQAIYSFRNADLHTYLAAGAQAVGHYSLAANQRSTAALIRALNALFTANPRAFMLDGLDYQPVECGAKPRTALADASGGDTAALQVWTLPDDPATGEPVLKGDADRLAAEATAAEIARLLTAARQGVLVLGEGATARPLAAGDVAVLVRSHAQGSRMRHALAALGVGSVELSQDSVLRSADAAELARLLDAVLEPARERTLKAALATEAMGVDAEGLVALAQDEAALLATVQRFLDYRETWARRGVGVMLRQWMAAEDVAARLLARPDGERRLTNLLHLFELLHEAGETRPAPDALLQWFRAQRQAPDAGEAAQLRLESDQDLVQIVTVHKSKGLEYPFVFCPFLWGAEAAPGDGLEGAAYHDDHGRAVIDYGIRLRDRSAQDAVKAAMQRERAAEDLRLVYVALTRAVHRCVLVAGCYSKRTANGGVSATGSTHGVLNWLVAGAGLAPADWFAHKLGAPAMAAAWQALAARAP